MRNSGAKRDRILEAASRLFLTNGYERTTFARVSKESGAAVGSIVHFYDNKAGLAAAVHDRAAAPLVKEAEAALCGHATDVAAAIRALLSACVAWPVTSLTNLRLVDLLEAKLAMDELVHRARVRDRLAQVLDTWARPLTPGYLPRLLPLQLYAIILAPVLSAATPSIVRPSDGGQKSNDWLERLIAAALAAIGKNALTSSASGKAGGGARRRRSAPGAG